MALNEFIGNCLVQHSVALVKALDGLSPQELSWKPDRQCMSIGFVVWHLARAQDFMVQTVANGGPQLWEGEWADRSLEVSGVKLPQAAQMVFGYRRQVYATGDFFRLPCS